MFQVLIITIVLLALAFTGFAIKILVKKDGEFKKSCSSKDPDTGERIGCVCGSSDGGSKCENKRTIEVQPVEID